MFFIHAYTHTRKHAHTHLERKGESDHRSLVHTSLRSMQQGRSSEQSTDDVSEWGMSHLWWSMPHAWRRHVTHMNEACHRCEGVMSQMSVILMSQMSIARTSFQPMQQGCSSAHTHQWVVLRIDMSVRSHAWMRVVSRINETCLAREWVMLHTWMNYVAHVSHV